MSEIRAPFVVVSWDNPISSRRKITRIRGPFASIRDAVPYWRGERSLCRLSQISDDDYKLACAVATETKRRWWWQ